MPSLGALTWLSAPLALFIGTVGAVSVFKAVYVDNRELKSRLRRRLPAMFRWALSLTENLMMIAMAVYMLAM